MVFRGFLRYNSKIVVHTLESVSRRRFSSSRPNSTTNFLKSKQPFIHGAKRFYRGLMWKSSRGWRGWMWNLETTLGYALFSGLFALDFCIGNWETTVPFTKRRQFLLIPPSFYEPTFGKYKVMMNFFKRNELPPSHPDSVRAERITRDLIEAFRREEGDALMRKRWEVMVVDIHIRHALSFPPGKIITFSGILDFDDAEIAAFLAPEIVSLVVGYPEEIISRSSLLSKVFLLILHMFLSSMPSLLKIVPFSRSFIYFISEKGISRLLQKFYSLKFDVEADHIGLLLVASAGYDPRIAWQAREKVGWMKNGSSWEKMKARLLVLHMDEALSIYREVTDARNV